MALRCGLGIHYIHSEGVAGVSLPCRMIRLICGMKRSKHIARVLPKHCNSGFFKAKRVPLHEMNG